MTNCTTHTISFPPCRKRPIEVDFGGGDVSSNAGVLLLREADRRLGLTKAVSLKLPDERQPGKVVHKLGDMLRQRVFGIALGYEDLNDHDALRHDLALQTAAGCDAALASAPSLCRFENRAEPEWAWAIHDVLADVFIASFETAPEEIVLDIDATDDAVHGHQVGRFFHGYYDHYCFLPLYVFCGDHLLVAYLVQEGPRPPPFGIVERVCQAAFLPQQIDEACVGVRLLAGEGCFQLLNLDFALNGLDDLNRLLVVADGLKRITLGFVEKPDIVQGCTLSGLVADLLADGQ